MLLIVTLPLKPAAFSDACESYSLDTSIKISWFLRCEHHIVKVSTKAGQV